MFLKSHFCVFIIGVVGYLLRIVQGHSNGAPLSRCESMTPGHWVAAQSVPPPYRVTISQDSIAEGEMLSIELMTINGNPGFKGFLIMVKKGNDTKSYGHFDLSSLDENTIPLDCFGIKGSAVTHKDSGEKRTVKVKWIAPLISDSGSQEDYEAKVTFVQNFWTIWTDVTPGKMIRVTKSPIDKKHEEIPVDPIRIPQVPQIRDIDAGNKDHSSTGSTTNQQLPFQGSWDHFKRSWFSFMEYMGFS